MTNLSGANLNNGAAVGSQGEGRDSPRSFPKYPTYKYSGVEWLGEVPERWEVFPLKRDLLFLTSGSRGWAEHYSETGALFLRIGNLRRNSLALDLSEIQLVEVPSGAEGERTKVIAGDVLFSITAYLGSVAVVPSEIETAYVSQHVALARICGELLCPRWVGYVALSWVGKTYLESQGYGGTKVQLSLDDIANMVMTSPSPMEQEIITRFLDHETARIDALIEEQQRLIELLKEKRQTVISHAVTKGLDPTVPMKDSGVEWLGEVPAHWVVLAIKWRARIKSGDGISPDLIESQAQEDKPHPVIGGNGVMGFTSQANVSPPLIVIGRVGALCGNVHKIHEPAWVSDNALILDFDRRSFDINYLVHVLGARNLNEISDKSAQPLITGSKVTSQYIPCPSRHEQLAIAKLLEGALSEFDQLVLEGIKGIELLKERRSALISAAVTGKIDVRGWQPPASAPTPELVQEAV